MLGVHLENGIVSIRNSPRPRRPTGYSLIHVLAAGICNTDLELQRGYYGFSGRPGHEFVGRVIESDTPRLIGKRVVGEINLACERCDWCRRGLGRHCPKRSVLGIVKHPGAFAEFLTLPDRNLYIVPGVIPTQLAIFAEPLAAACEILEQVRIPKDASVAVLGDGKLGLLISQVLHAHGARVLHYGRHKEKLRIAAKAGVTTELAGKRIPRAQFDFVVEATGAASALETAVKMTKPRGTVILKSTVHNDVAIDTAPVIVNEITLVGSRCGRFEPAIRLLKTGKVRVDAMISAVLPLAEAPRAFASAAERGAMKVLLLPPE